MRQEQTFPGRFDQVPLICRFVTEGARQARFERKQLFHIELACDEASTNIIEHAYADVEDGEIEVAWQITDQAFRISLHDSGQPFDPQAVKRRHPFSEDTLLDDVAIGGLGMHFMRQLMDEVLYTFDDTGNTVTLVKWLPPTTSLWHHTLHDGIEVVTVLDRIDAQLAPELDKLMKQLAADDSPRIVVDLDAVPYINSAGLRAVVSAWRSAHQKNGDVVLANLAAPLREIVSMVGFDKIFRIFPTRDAALDYLRTVD